MRTTRCSRPPIALKVDLHALKKDGLLRFDFLRPAIQAMAIEPEAFDLSPALKAAVNLRSNAFGT